MPLAVYRSSAGSGKTYTLAKQYVGLLLLNPYQHPNILAVTFTNKATQEMKHRIVQFLAQLARQENPSLKEQLAKERQIPQRQIAERAQKALIQILHGYSAFSILTIDSFFNRVIKQFAQELGLPLGMELELDTAQVLNQAFDQLMLQMTAPHLRSWLNHFIEYQIQEGKSWRIDTPVKTLGKSLFEEQFDIVVQDIDQLNLDTIKEIQGRSRIIKKDIAQKLHELGKNGLDILEAHGLAPEDIVYGKSGVGNVFNKLYHFNGKLEFTKRPLEAVDHVEKWHKKRNDPNEVAIVEAYHAGLNGILKEAIAYWAHQEVLYNTAELVSNNLYTLGLLKQLHDNLKHYRDEHQVVFISDQNRLINRILAEDGLEFMYEKTGSRFRHFLIDEFQDTSTLQWNNFRPLLTNGLSSDPLHEVLLVGDAKQSIYRWRGGNVQLLLGDAISHLGQEPEDTIKHLDANYRSYANIIAFNNAFFKQEALVADEKDNTPAPELIQQTFEDVHQKTTANTPSGGYVEIQFFEPNADDSKPAYGGSNSDEALDDDEDPVTLEAVDEALIDNVKALLAEGYSPGDLAVLVFKNKEGVRVAELLAKHGIAVQSKESLKLSQSPAIKLLLLGFRFLLNPLDPVLRAGLLHCQWQWQESSSQSPFPPSVFQQLLRAETATFMEVLPASFSLLAERLQSLDLYQLFAQMCNAWNMHQFDHAYLIAFGETILDFQQRNGSHLQAFLQWWDEKEDQLSIQSPEGQNAVVIQTVHRAKGLQYRVVLMPFVSKALSPKTNELIWAQADEPPFDQYGHLPISFRNAMAKSHFHQTWQKEVIEAQLDALNGLYVGFTRAIERLYVFPLLPKKTKTAALEIQERIASIPGIQHHDDQWQYGEKQKPSLERTRKSTDSELTLRQIAFNLEPFQLHIKQTTTLEPGEYFHTARWRGQILHQLLSQIYTPKDLKWTLQQAVLQGIIKKEEEPSYRQDLEGIFSIEGARAIFNPEASVYNERALLHDHGKMIRPDRVLIADDQILVVDFKSGALRKPHEKQVLHYGEVLHKTMPDKTVSGMLLYISERKIVKVG